MTDSNINPVRSKPVQNDIVGKVEPGAIGNGAPLMELMQGKLPPKVTLIDEDAGVLNEAIGLAIKLSVANQKNVSAIHQKRFQQALNNLIGLQNNLKAKTYLFNADVRSPEDYLVGFNYGENIGLSVELMHRLYSISTKRLAQYIFHECVPEKGIISERDDHRAIYNEIQSAIFGQDEVVALKKDLRKFIDNRTVATLMFQEQDRKKHKLLELLANYQNFPWGGASKEASFINQCSSSIEEFGAFLETNNAEASAFMNSLLQGSLEPSLQKNFETFLKYAIFDYSKEKHIADFNHDIRGLKVLYAFRRAFAAAFFRVAEKDFETAETWFFCMLREAYNKNIIFRCFITSVDSINHDIAYQLMSSKQCPVEMRISGVKILDRVSVAVLKGETILALRKKLNLPDIPKDAVLRILSLKIEDFNSMMNYGLVREFLGIESIVNYEFDFLTSYEHLMVKVKSDFPHLSNGLKEKLNDLVHYMVYDFQLQEKNDYGITSEEIRQLRANNKDRGDQVAIACKEIFGFLSQQVPRDNVATNQLYLDVLKFLNDNSRHWQFSEPLKLMMEDAEKRLPKKASKDEQGAQVPEDMPVRAQVFKTNLTRILAEYPDQVFFMGIETDIGESQKAQIMPVYKAIDEIQDLKDSSGKPLFPNLMIKRESAEKLASTVLSLNKEGKLNLNNTFIGARKISVDNKAYDAIKGEGMAWISAIDDSRPGDYLPVFEVITLNLMAYLNADLSAIKNFYDTISDKPIDPDVLQDMIRNRIIYILPRATKFDTKQLRELYELAHQVYIAA